MKHILLSALAATLTFGLFGQYEPPEWNLKARRQYAENRFGIFIHWGLYANYAQGESYLKKGRLSEKAYSRMKDGFCPSKFDAKEWVRVFKDAGARYVTITSRHHDGFSLWPTKVDDGYNIANTPFKRDILGELAKECQKAGLQLNFYYSLMDWHRSDYPAGESTRIIHPDQKGDYPTYKRFMLDQIAELIDSYRPGCIWFDGEWEHAPCRNGVWTRTLDWEFDDLYDLIHSKHVLVANNNHQPIREKEDVQLFERDLPGMGSDSLMSKHQPVADDRPLEQCDVIQKSAWGYKIGEMDFRMPEDAVTLLVRAASKGSNLLLNIGPDGSGRLPEEAVKVLRHVGEWIDVNGESVYGTRAGHVSLLRDVVSTCKDDVLYLHFLNPKISKFAFSAQCEFGNPVCLDKRFSANLERTSSGDVVVTVKRPSDYKFDVVVRMAMK